MMDIVVADWFGCTVGVFRGDGMGGFASEKAVLGTVSNMAVGLGDANQDGSVDVVVGGSGRLGIVLGASE